MIFAKQRLKISCNIDGFKIGLKNQSESNDQSKLLITVGEFSFVSLRMETISRDETVIAKNTGEETAQTQ